jgi:hypothetical protein
MLNGNVLVVIPGKKIVENQSSDNGIELNTYMSNTNKLNDIKMDC